MYHLHTLVIVLALAGAVIALTAALGRFSGRLGDRAVDRLYYVSYGFTGLSVVLFIMRGLFAERP